MPRIGDIDLKATIESTDKFLGSDNIGVPHNYYLETIRDYVLGANYNVGVTALNPPSFTDNGDGTATIGATTIAIRDNDNHTGSVNEYSVPEDTFTFTDNTEEYVIVNYNSGTPIYEKSSTPSNGSDTALIYVVWRAGLTLHSIDTDSLANGLPNKINARLLYVDPYAVSREGGLLISETTSPTNRTILVSAATVFAGVIPFAIGAFNSSTDDMYKVIYNGTGWDYTLITQYNNTTYNPVIGGEVIAGNNKYIYNLYYRSIGDDMDVFMLEGEDEYNSSAEAYAASEIGRTSIPILVRNHCLFIGRSIIQKDATTGETTSFIRARGNFTTYIPMHNDIVGLQGGTINEYYHLTSAEQSIVDDLPYIGDVAGGNYSEFEPDGTHIFHGNATVWEDLNVQALVLPIGFAAPDNISWRGGNILCKAFNGTSLTETLYWGFEYPHKAKENADFVLHLHWAPTTAGSGNVKWQADIIIERNAVGTVYSNTLSSVSPTNTTAWEIQRTNIGTITGVTDGIKIGDQVAIRLFRNPTDIDDTYNSDAAIAFTVGIHYEIAIST